MIADEEQAQHSLRRMPHTRDTVLNLVLIEAGLRIENDELVRTRNIDASGANLGLTPELALARVVVRYLGRKPR